MNAKVLAANNKQGEQPRFTLINFLNELGLHLLDTYLVVLMALDEIIQSNSVVNEKNLIESLHFAIINMYNSGLLPRLQACLQVTIKTALHRFATIGIINISTYRNENGSRISYVSGNPEQLKVVQEKHDELMQLQKY